jgi:hypothetical protein
MVEHDGNQHRELGHRARRIARAIHPCDCDMGGGGGGGDLSDGIIKMYINIIKKQNRIIKIHLKHKIKKTKQVAMNLLVPQLDDTIVQGS